MKKNIGFISCGNPLDRSLWSGTIYKLYDSMQQAGLGVVWIPEKKSPWYGRYKKILECMGKYFNRRFSIIHTLLGAMLTKVDVVDLKNVDILFAPGCAVLYRLKTDKPVIYLADATFKSIYNYYECYSNFFPWHIWEGNRVEKRALSMATHIIYSSDWAKNSAIKDYGIDSGKISVIEFGANIEKVNRREQQDNIFHILFIGVDWIRKGGDIAVETCKLLNQRGIQSIIHIIGIREIPIEYQNVEYIDFIGFLDKSKVDEYDLFLRIISLSDILLLPTRAECSAIVFAEAAAYGIPSFTYDTGGLANYVVNGVNGYRLPLSCKAEDFVTRISICLSTNEMERLKIGAHSLYEQRLNWKTWSKRFKEIVDTLP